jgi:hypothetical protein
MSTSNLKNRFLISLLALSSLFFAVLMPPEAYAAGKMVVIVIATFVFLIAVSEKRVSRGYIAGGAAAFGLLFIHSIWISIDAYRSLEFLTLLWAYYCLAGFFMYSGADWPRRFAGAMVGLSLLVSCYGLYQYFWGFEHIYNYISHAGSDQILKAPALERIATKRVFSTLALPGTLWGFLLVALPLHGLLWKRNRVLDGVLVASIALSLATGFLTRSFGFLIGSLVLVATALWFRHRRLVWNRVTPVILLLLISGGLFYSARRGAIESANPVALRFKNWVSAWSIFQVHPLGTGLNNFGVAYPEYMQPAANETQYVHNTPLQLLAELGYVFVITVLVAIIVLAKPRRNGTGGLATREWTWRSERLYLLLALSVWLVHNMVDINVYFGSLGVIGAVLIGVLFSRPAIEREPLRKTVIAGISLLSVSVIVFSGVVFVSSELQHRAQVEYENLKPLAAVNTLETAKKICPFNSSLYHDSGEILLDLYTKTRETQYLDRATEAYRTAVNLSPRMVGPHIGLGLCLSSANNVKAALEEIHAAQQLYPDSTYALAIARLMEQRVQ